MRQFVMLMLVATLAAGTTLGCKKDEPVDTSSGGENVGGDGDASAQRSLTLNPRDGVESTGEPCALGRVFFEYDSSDLTAESRNTIEATVQCFRERGQPARMHLVGATDPRGTEEYNIALGERRAESVRRYLSSLGVDGGRINVTSVGEEHASGTDEAGWAEDRNVSGDTQ